MKKILFCMVAVALVLSFGLANADELRIPKHIQNQYEQETGTKANFAIWFPVVPEQSWLNWTNILFISNFNEIAINVQCWFTSWAMEQTVKSYTLRFYEKKIVELAGGGFSDNELYDIFCVSNQLFGAAVLLVEGGNIVTAWPPIF